MTKNNINGILVGCDDYACNFSKKNPSGGYCWVIKMKDWDNANNEITNNIERYKHTNDFHIYFYVYKTPTNNPDLYSRYYRNTIFGFADIVDVVKKKYENGYQHHVKIDNLRPFSPKIKLEKVIDKLEFYDWSENQIQKFGANLSHHGLLLTKNDCEVLQSFY
jgi:hypothetical protein